MVNGGERANTTSYEEERAETLSINQEKLHQLIPRLAEKSSHEQNNKTKKRQHTYSQPALEMPRRVLRSDTARADSRHDDEDMRDAALEENEDDVNAATQHDGGQQQKKHGRSYTRKADIRSRGNQPPIRLEINEKGQPVGDNATEFANFIATLVKNSEIISLAKPDWRLVEPKQKLLLWNTLKLYYEVDERVKDWVMGSAAKKWRDFKSDLKALYFDEEKTDEELLAVCDDNRVHEDDWKWLIDHWRTEGSKQRSEIGKLNRQGMTLFHTTGSKSHARVIEEEHKKNGYRPRRDEAFVITHTSKKGVPSNAAAAKKIKELENKANEQPELLEKTIEQGDLFSQVFGKERNGYVRCIGLGPSASDLRMPGTRKLKSTKLQMAEEECRQAMEEAALLRERVEATDRKMDIVMNEVLEMKKMMLASQAKEKEQFSPHYDSNYALNGYIDDEGENSETGYMAAEKHDDHVISSRPMLENQAEITHHKKQVLVQQMNQLDHQNTTVTQKTPQVGQDVILYSISRPYNIPVEKATIQSIDRMKIVAGAELGSQCCEVVVNMVMKKDAILQRPSGNVRTMANALGRSIAWPRRYIEVIRKDMQKQP